MSEIQQPVVLLIGDCDSPSFRRALLGDSTPVAERENSPCGDSPFDEVFRSFDVRRACSVQEAIAKMASSGLNPGFVVTYQSVPDEYSKSSIDQLIGMLPLSRFVVVFSPWCESIGRTELRWPSAWSVPVSHAAARIRYEQRQLAEGRQPLPATTSRDEAFVSLAANSLKNTDQSEAGISVAVLSADAPLQECFEDIVRAVGCSTSNLTEADVCILATAFVDGATVQRVEQLRTSHPQLTVVVASDMVTHGQVSLLRGVGVSSVLSQLRFAEDLVDYLSTQLVSS